MNSKLIRAVAAEHKVAADLAARGLGVAWPTGHGHPFDLILIRDEGTLERVQVKYTQSDGDTIKVKCASTSAWVQYSYTNEIVEWIAVWDETTDRCYYLPAEQANGRQVTLRLTAPQNRQVKGIRWARDFLAV